LGLIPDLAPILPGLGLIQAGGGCRELSIIPIRSTARIGKLLDRETGSDGSASLQ